MMNSPALIGIPKTSDIADNQGIIITASDMEILELKKSFSARYNFIKQHIGDNQEVDKAKPMMMVGSGPDLSVFLGSGIDKGYYIDPIYRYSHSKAGIKLGSDVFDTEYEDILEQLRISEGVTDVIATPSYVGDELSGLELTSSVISFTHNGHPRELNIITTSDLHYIPDDIKKNGCSLYAAIGVGSNLILPRVKSDFYAVSALCAEALGYSDIVAKLGGYGNIAITKDYNPVTLTRAEINIIHSLSLDMLANYLRTIEYNLEEEFEKSKKLIAISLFPDKQNEIVNQPQTTFFALTVEKFFKSLEDLDIALRKKVLTSIEQGIESIFPNPESSNEEFNKSLEILKNHLLSLRIEI